MELRCQGVHNRPDDKRLQTRPYKHRSQRRHHLGDLKCKSFNKQEEACKSVDKRLLDKFFLDGAIVRSIPQKIVKNGQCTECPGDYDTYNYPTHFETVKRLQEDGGFDYDYLKSIEKMVKSKR